MYRGYFKRFIDLLISIILLVILSPVFLIISIIIKIDSKGPVLFTQNRVGLNNKDFKIYKFRTMKVDAPSNSPTDALENAQSWITNVGKFLRKTSLDEIPQLINIISGQMSFVGPRPSLRNQENLNELRLKYNVFTVRPGITGWAQVNGRDELTNHEKALYDYEYVKKISLSFDIKCIIKTVSAVIFGKNIVEGKK
ncbi:MAG: sugar transferase [Erysipelotrichales bacterium]|nr:sugar transferase [Erysipelotrichales bacterium]